MKLAILDSHTGNLEIWDMIEEINFERDVDNHIIDESIKDWITSHYGSTSDLQWQIIDNDIKYNGKNAKIIYRNKGK